MVVELHRRLVSCNTGLNLVGTTQVIRHIRNGYTYYISNELYIEIHSDGRLIELIPKSKGHLLIEECRLHAS